MGVKRVFKPLYIENIDEITSEISHLVSEDKNAAAKKLVKHLHPSDLASVLDHSSYKTQKSILKLLKDTIDPESLIWVGEATRLLALEVLGSKKLSSLVEKLDLEDCIEILEDYDDQVKNELIGFLPKQKQEQVKRGLNYPEDSVGRIMETQFLVFAEHWTTEQAIKAIKSLKSDKDPHAAIIVDKEYKPVATLSLNRIFRAPANTQIRDLFNEGLKVVQVADEISELVYFFKQYALAIVPVVNASGKLLGSVSIENMLYIVEENTETSIMSLTGVKQDTFSTIVDTVRSRFLWLFTHLIIAFITSSVIANFGNTISSYIALASIMPIVASMGGNAGTQVMTVTVLALAKRDINRSNILRVIGKEVSICLVNAIILGFMGALLIVMLYNDFLVSIVFASAVILNFAVAGFFGSLIPIILDKMDLDPASASSVFLTGLTDSFGFFAFLGLYYLCV